MLINQALTVELVTTSLVTGAAKNADALPTALLRRNGSVVSAVVTVTQIGTGRYKTAVLIAAADAWVPGDCYSLEAQWDMEGTAGIVATLAQGSIKHDLNALLTSILQKVSTTKLTVVSPVLKDGSLEIVQGDDYTAVNGRPILFTLEPCPYAAGATAKISIKSRDNRQVFSTALTILGTTLTGIEVRCELPRSFTASLSNRKYLFDIQVTLPTGEVATPVIGGMVQVIKDIST